MIKEWLDSYKPANLQEAKDALSLSYLLNSFLNGCFHFSRIALAYKANLA